MLKKIFKKKKQEDAENKSTLIASLLIHAAKIDENYTDVEKKIIKKAIMNLNKINSDKAEELYADPTNAAILGSLPRQYQEILNRDLTKQEAGKYGKALLWQAGKGDPDSYTQGTVRDDGTYPVTITPGGKDNPNFLKKPKDKIE